MNEARLESLLAGVPAPPLPDGLADRVAAAATGLPQEARPASARRAVGRDRRGAWLRRPLIGGAIALGLAFSGAVAATLAGVPLPSKVEAVIAQIPFVGRKLPEPEHVPVRHAAARPLQRAAPVAAEAAAADSAPPPPLALQPRPAALRRMMLAQRIVARRAAMGLPSPPVQRVERMIHRRQMMRRWERATPEERAQFLERHPRAAAMIEAREARGGAVPGQAEPFGPLGPEARGRFAQREAFRNATPEQRQAFLAAHPRFRAMMEARRARRQARLEGQAEPLPPPQP